MECLCNFLTVPICPLCPLSEDDRSVVVVPSSAANLPPTLTLGAPQPDVADELAVGDVLEGVPELMPVAQKSGKLLAHRIHDRMIAEKSEDDIFPKP